MIDFPDDRQGPTDTPKNGSELLALLGAMEVPVRHTHAQAQKIYI